MKWYDESLFPFLNTSQRGRSSCTREETQTVTNLFGIVAILVQHTHVSSLRRGQSVTLDNVPHHDTGRTNVCNRIPRYTPPHHSVSKPTQTLNPIMSSSHTLP